MINMGEKIGEDPNSEKIVLGLFLIKNRGFVALHPFVFPLI
jgi:hypothetical protein